MRDEIKIGFDLKQIDLPPRVAEELVRLHKLILDPPNIPVQDWALKKIDHIHKVFLFGPIGVVNPTDKDFK